jgi:signal transduction histidine kinase
MASSGPWQADDTQAGTAHAKILVVDDDERNLFAATSALAALGHEIVVAKSGEDALRCLLSDEYAVILLDLHMPGMDGYETAAMIRQRHRTHQTPIVFLTAVFRDEAHLFQAYSAGAVDVVFKPVDPFILRSKVQVLVDLHLKTQAIQAQSEHRQRLLDEYKRVQREKAAAEGALRRSQERQRAILNALPVVLHSNRARMPYEPLFVSDNVEELTGVPAEEFMRTADLALSRIHPDDIATVLAAFRSCRHKGHYSCEFRWLHADGEYRRFLDQGVLTPSDGTGPGEIQGTLLDVTEQRVLEEQLIQARKMETVGQLTGGVAHDFNNLLTIVIGNIELLGRGKDLTDKAQRQLGAIRYAAERGQKLTQQLLAFSRRQQLLPQSVDVNALVARFLPLLEQALSDSITVNFEPYAGDVRAFVDPAQLENALLNLAVNARDAMPEGGSLFVRLSVAASLPAPFPASEPGQSWVQIEVADTGTGIPPDVLQRIFEPFFTTKDVGKGSGLGLSQVYGFAQQSGGHVTADNGPDGGARFSIFLRWSEEVSETAAPAVAQSKGAPQGASILVVEDDELVRDIATEILTDLGYRVSTAANAAEAMATIEADPSIDLLFSDISMPGGLNGLDLARQARALRPGLKVLLSSGYANTAADGDFDGFELIEKPYDPSDLAQRLSALLARSPVESPRALSAPAKARGPSKPARSGGTKR